MGFPRVPPRLLQVPSLASSLCRPSAQPARSHLSRQKSYSQKACSCTCPSMTAWITTCEAVLTLLMEAAAVSLLGT